MSSRALSSDAKDMMENESFKRIVEGLKLSASCAREMHCLEPKMGWMPVCKRLEYLIIQCRKLAHTKAFTRQALLAHAGQIQSQLGVNI